MCFTEITHQFCGHCNIKNKECRASQKQQLCGRPKERSFWERLFGRRKRVSKVQCTTITVDKYVNNTCSYCLEIAARKRKYDLAKANKEQSQKQMTAPMRGQQASWAAMQDKSDFRCARCKLEKRYPLAEQRSGNLGLCCANGVDEFEDVYGPLGDQGPKYVQANSSAVRTDHRVAASDRTPETPAGYLFSERHRLEDPETQANSSAHTGNPPTSQDDNPTGIDFERWSSTVLRTDHGSYPTSSFPAPDTPLPTRPLTIRKAVPTGRQTSEEQNGGPSRPSRYPERAIPTVPSPPEGSSFRAIYDSPAGLRRKPVPSTHRTAIGIDAHYYPPASPPARNSSLTQTRASLPVLRSSVRRIPERHFSSVPSSLSLRSPVPVAFQNRDIVPRLELQASQAEMGEALRRCEDVAARIDLQCDEIEGMWRRSAEME